MSEENVEVLYQASDALNRHDLDAFLALCDPEVTFISYLTQVEGGGPYRGHEGVRDWWKRLLAIYPDFRGEVEEVQEVGDRTIARARVHARGVESDVRVDQTIWQVMEYRHRKVIWWHFVRQRDRRPRSRRAAGVVDYLDSLPWARSIRIEPERFFDVDDERVLVFVHISLEGEVSGVPVGLGHAYEFTIRDGMCVRWKVYADRAEALKAAGLSE